MSTIEAIEARLRSKPDDWDSWRVYGDWLLDRDDARGEIIQIEHRRANGGLSSEERRRGKLRVAALVEEHGAEWRRGLVLPEGARLSWRFGFVVGIRLVLGLRSLPALEQTLAHPTARLLTRLDLRGNALGDEGVIALTRSAVFRQVVALDLRGNRLGAPGALALARGGGAPDPPWALTSLDLRDNDIGDPGASALAQAETLPSLTALDLGGNGIGPDGALALAMSEMLERLSALDLRHNRIGDLGADALASGGGRADAWYGLASLGLRDNRIGYPGVIALAHSAALGGLSLLDLAENEFDGEEIFDVLLEEEGLRSCEVLL